MKMKTSFLKNVLSVIIAIVLIFGGTILIANGYTHYQYSHKSYKEACAQYGLPLVINPETNVAMWRNYTVFYNDNGIPKAVIPTGKLAFSGENIVTPQIATDTPRAAGYDNNNPE